VLPEGTNDGEIASIRLRAKKLARKAVEAQSLRKEKSQGGREVSVLVRRTVKRFEMAFFGDAPDVNTSVP
jgi:hypothetical protein